MYGGRGGGRQRPNYRGRMTHICVWQGDMTRALDVSVCVYGGEAVGGGVGRGLTIEVERLVYVLRRRDPAMS